MNNFISWRQPGLYDVDQASLETALDTSLMPSMTQQHLGPDTDINVLVRRYGLTGELPVRRELAEYGNFDDTMDFATLLENVRVGREMFGQVPADVRAKFENNPAVFLEWIHDEANYDEAATLGLVPKRAGAAAAAAGEEVRAAVAEPKPVVAPVAPVAPVVP